VLEERPVPRFRFPQRRLHLADAQQGLDGGDQHRRVHGLGEVPVGTALQAAHGVTGMHERRGEVEHEHGRGGRVGLELATDVVPVHVGQGDIEDDEVGSFPPDQGEGLGSRGRLEDAVAGMAENAPHHVAAGLVVVDDDEDGFCCHHASALTAACCQAARRAASASSRDRCSLERSLFLLAGLTDVAEQTKTRQEDQLWSAPRTSRATTSTS